MVAVSSKYLYLWYPLKDLEEAAEREKERAIELSYPAAKSGQVQGCQQGEKLLSLMGQKVAPQHTQKPGGGPHSLSSQMKVIHYLT
jgi:hypothetical protein